MSNMQLFEFIINNFHDQSKQYLVNKYEFTTNTDGTRTFISHNDIKYTRTENTFIDIFRKNGDYNKHVFSFVDLDNPANIIDVIDANTGYYVGSYPVIYKEDEIMHNGFTRLYIIYKTWTRTPGDILYGQVTYLRSELEGIPNYCNFLNKKRKIIFRFRKNPNDIKILENLTNEKKEYEEKIDSLIKEMGVYNKKLYDINMKIMKMGLK